MNLTTIIGIVVLMLGVILVYDARYITRKIFSFGDQNEAVHALKITGFVMAIIGGFLIML